MNVHRPFRLGIVGTGMITRRSHLPAALASEQVEVTALVDSVPDRAHALAEQLAIGPTVAHDVAEVLPLVDGVVIATPNAAHRDIALRCLDAGVATLIEKPLAATREEGEEILRAARESACPVAVGFVTRFRRSIEDLHSLLEARYFGRVQRFFSQFGTIGGWAPVSDYILSPEAAGGGVLVVTGTHFLDRVLAFWGYPDSVEYFDDARGGPEANCVARFHYADRGEGEIHGELRYSKTVGLPSGMVIETDEAVIVYADTDVAEIVVYPKSSPATRHTVELLPQQRESAGGSIFQRQLEDFVDAVRTGRAPRVDCDAGLASLRLTEELYACRQPLDACVAEPAR